jgi:hypothetical protein
MYPGNFYHSPHFPPARTTHWLCCLLVCLRLVLSSYCSCYVIALPITSFFLLLHPVLCMCPAGTTRKLTHRQFPHTSKSTARLQAGHPLPTDQAEPNYR